MSFYQVNGARGFLIISGLQEFVLAENSTTTILANLEVKVLLFVVGFHF
jgi:hypothetical protein